MKEARLKLCRCDDIGELARSGGPLWPGKPGVRGEGRRMRVGRQKWRVVSGYELM